MITDSGTQAMQLADQTPPSKASNSLLRSAAAQPATMMINSGKRQRSFDQAAMLDFLCHPASYGQTTPVDRQVIGDATLFLSEKYCYKFLHYRHAQERPSLTRQERFRLMRQEMQLGRLFAPDIYCGLVPIVACDGHFRLLLSKDRRLKGEILHKGRIVDWLICMNRYDLTESYDKLVERRQPNHAECNHLATMLLSGIGKTNPTKAQPWLGWLEEQLDALAPFVLNLESAKERCQSHACLTRAKDRLAQLSQTLADRGQRGFLRPIHGNLSLANIVSLPSGLCSVNPDAGCQDKGLGDPIFDLAYLISELWSRNLSRQANWLLSHYCNQLLDSHAMDGVGALDLYLCYAALERAKAQGLPSAALTSATQPNALPPAGGHTIATEWYLRTARKSLLQDQVYLIILGGSNATDRSQLARLLAPAIGRMPGAIHLSSEREMLTLHEVARAEDLPSASHRQSVWQHVYRRLCAKAKLGLEAGYSVILDGNFCHPAGRLSLEQMLTNHDLERQVHMHAFWFYQSHHRRTFELKQKTDLERLAHEASTGHASACRICDGIPSGLGEWTSIDAAQPATTLFEEILSAIIPFWQPSTARAVH